MSGILSEIQRVINDLQSIKATVRNKAVEQLDQKLNSSRDSLNSVLAKNTEITWKDLFKATIDAVFKHAVDLDKARDKTFLSLENKRYLYGNVMDKIIDYNLERGRSEDGHFLAKSTIFGAFEEGFKKRIVVKFFGTHFLNMVDRGIFLSPKFTCDLKVSEYSRILSYMFEVNIENNNQLSFRILQCITQTVRLAYRRVQLHSDLVDYLPTLSCYCSARSDTRTKVEIVRIYQHFVRELSVTYHYELCIHMQEILSYLCDFYNEDAFRDDSKNVFFECVLQSLHALYPKLSENVFSTFHVPINENWPQTMQKMKTIINMEIQKHSMVLSKSTQLNSDKFSITFIKMSALIMYILLWHMPVTKNSEEAPSKRARIDKLDTVIKLIDNQKTSFNDIWFAIFAVLLQLNNSIIDVANYEQTLQITVDILLKYVNSTNLRNVRLCITSLLIKEQELLKTQSIPINFLAELWSQIPTHLISESQHDANAILETQLIFQALIKHNKLSPTLCAALIKNITTNALLKRNECIATIREIFIHADHCGLDKASAELEPIIKWAFTLEKSSATQMIHNIAAIDSKLLADTFAIGIINFLDDRQLQQLSSINFVNSPEKNENLQLLQYKYNKQLVCLEEKFQSLLLQSDKLHSQTQMSVKNCVFQNNYELFMRMLNIKTTDEHSTSSILKDLKSLHKLVCTMERLLHYKTFDAKNLTQCPLIKRIGLFLSHIEFQYKATQPENIDDSDLRDILQQQIAVLNVFNSNETLLQYMEKQPIEMLIEFIGVLLKYNFNRRNRAENPECSTIITQCLHILGCLCANSSYSTEAFGHISKMKNLHRHPEDIMLVTKMLCRCKSLSNVATSWLVENLKCVLRDHYLNVDIISQIVENMPSIFYFCNTFEHLLDDMLEAMNSLLKMTLRKAYPTLLSVKVVHCVGQIAQNCPNIYTLENFAVICTSVVKFLTTTTLEVRFATVSTLTMLFNINYCVSAMDRDNTSKCEQHLEFCEKLYENIDWTKLTFTSQDLIQNSNSVIIQTLIAFFAFSTFHQEISLKNLLQYIAVHKLKENDFYALQNYVPSYNLTMCELIRPFTDMLLCEWNLQHWDLKRFPYFLCYNTEESFRNSHFDRILTYAFLYGKREDVQCPKLILSQQPNALCLLSAFLAANSSDCVESKCADFQQHHQNLKRNLTHFKFNPLDDSVNAITIYNTIMQLHDKNELAKLLGSTALSNQKPAWYNICANSLFKSLCVLLNGNPMATDKRIECASLLVLKYPSILIDLLGMLKTDCYRAVLSSPVMRCFFQYCIIVDAILDLSNDFKVTSSADKNLFKVNCSYFVCDAWYFVIHFLLQNNCVMFQRSALLFIQHMQSKQSFLANQPANHLNELAKLLVACVRHVKPKQLKLTAVSILKTFINIYKEQLDEQSLLDEADECEDLHSLYELFEKKLPNNDEFGVEHYIRAYLKPKKLGHLSGLRQYIAKNKDELQKHDQVTFDLISRLLKMVRGSLKPESSIDALKCLAEIGPLKMNHINYFFQTEFDAFEQSDVEPKQHFISVLMETLDKHLFNFNISTQKPFIRVAVYVVNSEGSDKLLAQYQNLRIFRRKSKRLGNSYSIPPIDWLDILKSTEHLDYEPWLCKFMSEVFEMCGWQGFDDYAVESFSFSKACLQPFLKMLMINKELHLDSLCAMLNYFFAQFCNQKNSTNPPKGIYQEKRVIKRFLYMCECIRLANNWSIPINLKNVLIASNHCQAYFLSVMYLEMWACSSDTADINILNDESFQMCAKTAYESIGCLDALSGFLDPLRSRIEYMSLNNNLSGILMESDNLHLPNSQLYFDIMKNNGMYSYANLKQRFDKTKEVDYEIFWRLGQWDEQVDGHHKVNMSNNIELEFKKHHYMALKSIKNREEENSLSAINNAYHCVTGILRDISIECLQSVYKYMSWLCTLQQAEDFCMVQFSNQIVAEKITEVFRKWQTELNLTYGNFNCKEHILSHQMTLFKMAGIRASRRIEDFYKQIPVDTYLLKCIGVCKDSGKLNLTAKYIATLRHLPDIKASTKISVLLEDADVNIRTGNYQIAKAILQHTVSNPDFNYCLQRVSALRMQGEFLLDSNAQSLPYVFEYNFHGALKILDYFEKNTAQIKATFPDTFNWENFDTFKYQNRKAVHAALAKYADREYQQLYDYRNSQEYQTLVSIIQQNRELASTATQRQDYDGKLGAIFLNRFAELDEKQLLSIEDNLSEQLCIAIEHHIAYCQLDNEFSSATIYRIIALWFTNDQNEKMLDTIKELITTVPSCKFICAINQLAGRLGSKHGLFQKILVDLLVRCGQDHPQHTFYKLYPFVYAHMDGNHSNTQRTDIATKIITKICHENPDRVECSKQFESMFPALINFANTYIVFKPNSRPDTSSVPEKLKKLNLLKINAVHCPTMELTVQASKIYDIISIVKWEKEYTPCDGLNAPVKVNCLCSDGVVRPQLIKGKDDLRQDAVMQQVFGIVNELFSSDSEVVEHNLQLRTYKVTPLSMRSGIIEWCSNTMPLSTYLIGDGTGGAHKKYRPGDLTHKQCKNMLEGASKKDKTIRLRIYENICKQLKPVLHYFLLERFPIPGMWFERRLAYTNSVATTSMVGYLLGLGDRHMSNILIDELSGEVVHIDFGIAFERGKIQVTPETVPFRLTRDIVAPMGVCGTNGVFTKSCQSVMDTLRRYKSVITTILEVLLYDPLFIWGVLSKEPSSQPSNEEKKNLYAQRALLLVQYKLEGREPGIQGNPCTKAQVQRLINEATLPSNLALLFHGWAPHL